MKCIKYRFRVWAPHPFSGFVQGEFDAPAFTLQIGNATAQFPRVNRLFFKGVIPPSQLAFH